LASEDSSVELKPIPECDTTIDLTILKGDELKRKVFELIEQLFPQWAKDVEGIQLDRVSGAMTKFVSNNTIVCVHQTNFYICIVPSSLWMLTIESVYC
jgi:hypothetical protein